MEAVKRFQRTVCRKMTAIADMTGDHAHMNERLMSPMSGAPDYELKELRSNGERVSAVLRMARAELIHKKDLVYLFTKTNSTYLYLGILLNIINRWLDIWSILEE